jgi:hypothetical protein
VFTSATRSFLQVFFAKNYSTSASHPADTGVIIFGENCWRNLT